MRPQGCKLHPAVLDRRTLRMLLMQRFSFSFWSGCPSILERTCVQSHHNMLCLVYSWSLGPPRHSAKSRLATSRHIRVCIGALQHHTPSLASCMTLQVIRVQILAF